MAISLTIDVLWGRPLAGQTEVRNLESALEVDEDIRRLEVEVDVTRLMYELESQQQFQQDLPDSEVVEPTVEPNSVEISSKVATLAVLSLDVEMRVEFPMRLDVEHMFIAL